MLIKYKKIWGNAHRGTHVDHTEYQHIEIESAKHCCNTMNAAFALLDSSTEENPVVFETTSSFGGEPIFGLLKRRADWSGEEDEIDAWQFCPYCGEKIVIECIGEYKWQMKATGNKVKTTVEEVMQEEQTKMVEVEVDETVPELVKIESKHDSQ